MGQIEMRFSTVLSRAARTEWRTAPKEGLYKPGKTFGFLPAGAPAYFFTGLYFMWEWGFNAFHIHQINEGGVARSPLSTRPRDPDLAVVECNGGHYKKNYEQLTDSKTPQAVQVLRMYRDHPGLVMDHAFLMYYLMIWNSVLGRIQEYKFW